MALVFLFINKFILRSILIPDYALFLLVGASIGSVLGIFFYLIRNLKWNRYDLSLIRSSKSFFNLFWQLPLIYITTLSIVIIISNQLGIEPKNNSDILSMGFRDSLPIMVILFLTSSVILPFAEEVLFRKVFFDYFYNKFSSLLSATVLSALIFSVIHIIPQMIIYTFIFGLFLGLLRIYYNSLWPCIVVHCFNNSLVFFIVLSKIA